MCCEIPSLHAHEIAALRRAAAMAHTVAGIALTLRSGGRPLASVMPGAAHDRWHDHRLAARHSPVLSPCGFRNAVARARDDHERGQRIAMIGQTCCGVDVEWSLCRPGAMLGFGGVRTHWAGRVVWALASLLPPDVLGAALDECGDDSSSTLFVADGLEARVVRDESLDVSIVHVDAGSASPPFVAAVDEVIRRLIATVTATEVVESLALA